MRIQKGLPSPEACGADKFGGDQQAVFPAGGEGAGFELGGL